MLWYGIVSIGPKWLIPLWWSTLSPPSWMDQSSSPPRCFRSWETSSFLMQQTSWLDSERSVSKNSRNWHPFILKKDSRTAATMPKLISIGCLYLLCISNCWLYITLIRGIVWGKQVQIAFFCQLKWFCNGMIQFAAHSLFIAMSGSHCLLLFGLSDCTCKVPPRSLVGVIRSCSDYLKHPICKWMQWKTTRITRLFSNNCSKQITKTQ